MSRYITFYGEKVPAWAKELLEAIVEASDTDDSDSDQPPAKKGKVEPPMTSTPKKGSLLDRRNMPKLPPVHVDQAITSALLNHPPSQRGCTTPPKVERDMKVPKLKRRNAVILTPAKR